MVLERRHLKEQLDVLYQNKAIGAQIRSKVRFVEERERSTEYFLAVEKHRQNNNCIKALTDKGITHSEDDEILNVASKFYTELYTSKTQGVDAINEFLDKVNLPELSPERQNSCEGIISQQECEDALKKIKSNKSPGDDGIPIEFYKAFWNEIGSLLVDVYNESFENKILPLSMRKSVITLIHKREDKTNIENYRPISLTNTDCRILACVLASRLQRVINDIVGPDQTAYIKGRFIAIGSNVRLVQDVFDLYNNKKLSGLFMFVDFEKAFDSSEWAFLFRTLAKFNLGCDFQQWVKLLYTSPYASVKNNGYSSSEFCLSRGVRQGCQVSALIFILCMEVMANHIRQNVNIRGLSLDEHGVNNIKIIQYADDATLFLKNSFEIKEAKSSLEQFGKIAGTKLNIGKCEELWIGSSKNRQNACTLYNIKWTKEPIRYLGIYIGYDSQKCFKLNFENRIRQVDEVLAQAAKRNLTLFGKVCIMKSLALAKIIYVPMCLVVPELVIKQMDHRIFRCLWGKRDRIKRKSIINKLEDGGLNMVDFRSQICAMKAAWATRVVTAPNNHLWAFLPKLYLSKYGEDFLILKTTATDKAMISCVKSIPEFYQDVIISYNKSKVINYEDFYNNVLKSADLGE